MKGKVFEKVGVNVSTVGGSAKRAGLRQDNSTAPPKTRRIFSPPASALVAHMANPHVPAVHMNTRFPGTTTKTLVRRRGGSESANSL
jgi:coproporphyrinogen III oxidase